MISVDTLILEFVSKNWLALGLLLVFLNGLCEIIPGTWDDKFVAIFKRMVTFTRQNSNSSENVIKEDVVKGELAKEELAKVAKEDKT